MLRWISGICAAFLLAAPAMAAEVLPPASKRFGPAESRETVSFQRHVMPLLGRMGCNGRACHGSFQGQGGFRLSLFGYDFNADLDALIEPLDGRYQHLEEGEERRALLHFTDGIGELLPASGACRGAAEALSQLDELEGCLCPTDDLEWRGAIEDKKNELEVEDDLTDDELYDKYELLLEMRAETAGGAP